VSGMASDREERNRIRSERRRRGWTQEMLVARMYRAATDHGLPAPQGLNANYISRWERGVVQPQPHHVHLLCLAFELSSEQLGLPGDSTPNSRSGLAPGQAIEQTAGGAGPRGIVDSDDVERREFAKLLLTLTGVAATGLDIERWGSVMAGTRIDEPALRDLETLTAGLVRSEATLAPHALMPAVHGHLAGLRDVVIWAPSSLAPRVYSLAGQAAMLAGYLMFKQERRGQAEAYWSLAERFGERSGDVRLRAAILLFRARAGRDDQSSYALALMDRAHSLPGLMSDPTVAALVLSCRALYRAEASRAGSSHGVRVMRDVDGAHTYLSRASGAAAGDTFYVWESVNETAIEFRAEAFLHLDRAHEAATEFDRVLASIDPAYVSWQSCVTMKLAAAHAKIGEPEHASELLSDSLRLAADASAPHWMRSVRDTRRRWLADYDGMAARRLDEQLRALTASATPGLSAG